MLLPYNEWRHVFKLDPAKAIEEEVLQAVATSGTDAIIVGGTDDITLDATLDLLMRLRRYPVAVALEVSELEAATMGFDTYLTPSVLNSGTLEHVIEKQVEALEEVARDQPAHRRAGEHEGHEQRRHGGTAAIRLLQQQHQGAADRGQGTVVRTRRGQLGATHEEVRQVRVGPVVDERRTVDA